MPKIVSDREKEMILNAIYQKTVALIKEKGLRNITVDDITQSVNMAKGSFYRYYPTKEECLYEVIKKSELEMFGKVQELLTNVKPNKELIIKVLYEIYIGENSLVLYASPSDFEALMRKLPEEYSLRETKKSINNFKQIINQLGINGKKINIGVLAHLMDSLSFLASKKNNQAESKEAIKLIIETIAEYLTGGIE